VVRPLAVMSGHIEEPSQGGGGIRDVNFNLAAVVQRLDAEERERLPSTEPKLIEAARGDPEVERLLNGPPVDGRQPRKRRHRLPQPVTRNPGATRDQQCR
jgi:hypothetical protein